MENVNAISWTAVEPASRMWYPDSVMALKRRASAAHQRAAFNPRGFHGSEVKVARSLEANAVWHQKLDENAPGLKLGDLEQRFVEGALAC